MSAAEVLQVALLGGLLALDSVSVAQVMVSRPIVATTISGAVFGAPEIGLVVGALLEMLALETMPFGASRYLEWSSASIVAAIVAASHGGLSPAGILVALLLALPTAWFAGSSMVLLRKINGRLAARRTARSGERGTIQSLLALGILLDFLRGAAVAALAVGLLVPLSRHLLNGISASAWLSVALVVAPPAAVAAAASWRLFAATARRRAYLAAGAILGVALLFTQ